MTQVSIIKPLYSTDEGDTVGVYDKYIKEAIRRREPLLIKSQNGQKLFWPKWVRKNCPVIEKVFLRQDEPMKLYKVFIPKEKPKSAEQLAKEEYLKSQGLL